MAKPLRLTVDLTKQHKHLHSSHEDPLVSQHLFDVKFIPNIVDIVATAEHFIDYGYWKSLLGGKSNRLARIRELNLVGLNDHSARSLALAMHDLRIVPTDVLFNGLRVD